MYCSIQRAGDGKGDEWSLLGIYGLATFFYLGQDWAIIIVFSIPEATQAQTLSCFSCGACNKGRAERAI